uniref:(northern house mosquito) hypothetical protein n=1 Tax=Culex pipiens TaxID=7175 RepID=A0A8D8IU58_CULPI
MSGCTRCSARRTTMRCPRTIAWRQVRPVELSVGFRTCTCSRSGCRRPRRSPTVATWTAASAEVVVVGLVIPVACCTERRPCTMVEEEVVPEVVKRSRSTIMPRVAVPGCR